MRGRSHARPFFIAFFLTLIILLFVVTVFAVDAQGRRLSFNDTSPAFEVRYHTDGSAELMVNAFSLHRAVNITGIVNVWHFIADFLCIPRHRFPRSVA